jgi:glycosyltransferase involved in cell wall biosynthesis
MESPPAREQLAIAAVVPTLDEAAEIVPALESLRRGGVDEIVVVDGGSRDGTPEKAAPLADLVIEGRGGLSAQLNQGAARAASAVLLFHYADVRFPPGGRTGILAALEDEGVVGGAFHLRFGSTRWRYRLTARAANVRNRLGLGPFGDQSLFARAHVFHALGGFSAGAFFEDLDLVRRLRRAGRFRIVPEAVEASVRRWESLGYARTLATHYWLYLVYLSRLGRALPRERRRMRELRGVR